MDESAPLPPSLSGIQAGGPGAPIAAPAGNPGEQANAVAQVREAVRLLEISLPTLPTGSEIYKAVLDSISKISKHAPAAEAVPGVQQTALANMAKQQEQQAAMQGMLQAAGQNQQV